MLLALNFKVDTHLASLVWLRDKKSEPYHQLLVVTIEDTAYLVEPGFGAPGPIEPLILTQNGGQPLTIETSEGMIYQNYCTDT